MDRRSFDRGHFYTHDQQALAYAERARLLRLMADWDAKRKTVREGKTYDSPEDAIKWETEERKCSKCGLPTKGRTPRGRAIHPACEGWVDELSDAGAMDLLYTVGTVLGVTSVEVK